MQPKGRHAGAFLPGDKFNFGMGFVQPEMLPMHQAVPAHPDRAHNADGAAALLNISARTLHRQLREEGASLQELKDEVRFERATELLNRTDKQVKQVAAAGFRNEKSFTRAFREWTGISPAAFRMKIQA